MRAAVLRALNEKLDVRDDVEVDGPGPGEVRVRILATGVCHSDISLQNGTLPHVLPAVPGHEGAGEIMAVGDGVAGLAAGDHVIVSWVAPCGKCAFCLAGSPNLCNYIVQLMNVPRFRAGDEQFFGMAGTGTFAEEIVIPAVAAIKIDPDVPLDVASLIGCGVMTGVGAALNTAKVRPGSSVVVFGCGGVGISAIQGARIAGAAEIVAVDLRADKAEGARRFGATHATTPGGLGAIQAEICGEMAGFDYAFEVVGLPVTIRQAWEATRRGGTTVVVGAGALTATVEFSAFELFYFERKLLGCWYGSADVRTDFHRLLRLWRMGKLDLEGMIDRRMDLSEINDAFESCGRGDVIRQVVEFT